MSVFNFFELMVATILSSGSISEIGFEIGYKEKSYFSNLFKKKTGRTPSEFRSEMNRLFT